MWNDDERVTTPGCALRADDGDEPFWDMASLAKALNDDYMDAVRARPPHWPEIVFWDEDDAAACEDDEALPSPRTANKNRMITWLLIQYESECNDIDILDKAFWAKHTKTIITKTNKQQQQST